MTNQIIQQQTQQNNSKFLKVSTTRNLITRNRRHVIPAGTIGSVKAIADDGDFIVVFGNIPYAFILPPTDKRIRIVNPQESDNA